MTFQIGLDNERLKDNVYAGLFINNLHPIAILELESGLVLANRIFCWHLGMQSEVLLNEIPFSALPFNDNPKFRAYLKRLKSGFGIDEEFVLELEPIEDFSHPLILKILPQIENGSVDDLIMTLTEQQISRKDLSLKLDRVAQMAAHDIREPLRTIGNYSQLLGKKYGDKLDENGKEYLHSIMEGVKQMDALLSDILNYSNQQSISHLIVQFSPEKVIREIERQISRSTGSKSFKVVIETMPATITTSIENFRTVCFHLMDNAVKFTRDLSHPIITCRGEEEKNSWKFSVSDNGKGIPKEFHNKIFLLFKRLHRRGEFPGNGLGLAICRRLINQQDGKIWISSEPGQGSTFYFTITKPQ